MEVVLNKLLTCTEAFKLNMLITVFSEMSRGVQTKQSVKKQEVNKWYCKRPNIVSRTVIKLLRARTAQLIE